MIAEDDSAEDDSKMTTPKMIAPKMNRQDDRPKMIQDAETEQ